MSAKGTRRTLDSLLASFLLVGVAVFYLGLNGGTWLISPDSTDYVEGARWRANGPTGYVYSDAAAGSYGIRKVGYRAGDPGKGAAEALGMNNARKGQTALPTGVVAALVGNTHPTIQLVTTDGFCLGATMNEVIRDGGMQYKARKR